MSPAVLRAITDFGDTALLAACLLVAVAFLVGTGRHREAGALALGFLLAGIMIGALKVAIIDCHMALPGLPLRSPSGHAAMAAATIGTGSLVAARGVNGWRSLAIAGAAFTVIVAIAASRVLLGVHTRDEVLVGLVVGAAAMGIAGLLLRDAPLPGRSLSALPVLLLAAVLLVHGMRLPSNSLVHRAADLFGRSVGACTPEATPVSRLSRSIEHGLLAGAASSG